MLFLDEAPGFAPQVIDALLTPLESGTVQISRSEGRARFPARFQLILAANPCPCGQGPSLRNLISEWHGFGSLLVLNHHHRHPNCLGEGRR